MNRVRIVMLLFLALLLTAAIAAPATAQAEFTCDSGQVITNGVQFMINVRPGDYRATAVGLNGFDPVLAAVESGTTTHLCNDDEPAAAGYAGALPSTGEFPPSGLTSQLTFNNPTNDFMNIDLLVGGLNGQGGEFVLIFEGMQVTDADGSGDPYAVVLNPSLVASDVGIHGYVIHITPEFDPLLVAADGNFEPIQTDAGPIVCDDASNAETCFVVTDGAPLVSLEGYYLTDGTNSVVGDAYDPYLSFPGAVMSNDIAQVLFLVTGAQYQQGMSTGDYVFAVHTGVAGPNGSTSSGNTGSTGNVIPPGQPGGPSNTTADVTPIACTETGVGELLGQGQENQFLNVECPANCSGSIWGTNVYTDDSAVCAAAIHAGVIPASGGVFAVAIGPGQTSYEGTTQNGITSASWGEWGRSIVPLPLIEDSSSSSSSSSSSGNTGSTGSTTADVTLQPIAYGDQLSAQVGSVAGDAYSFNASARDVVSIAVNSDDFDPLIIVTDTNGRELTRDDDSGPGFNALVSNLRIPNAGEYIIVVTSVSGALDVGTPYTIELSGG